MLAITILLQILSTLLAFKVIDVWKEQRLDFFRSFFLFLFGLVFTVVDLGFFLNDAILGSKLRPYLIQSTLKELLIQQFPEF